MDCDARLYPYISASGERMLIDAGTHDDNSQSGHECDRCEALYHVDAPGADLCDCCGAAFCPDCAAGSKHGPQPGYYAVSVRRGSYSRALGGYLPVEDPVFGGSVCGECRQAVHG